MKFGVVGLIVTCLSATTAVGATPPVSGQSKDASIPEYGFTLAPLAFVRFCMNYQAECDSTGGDDARSGSLQELRSINSAVNRAISPMHKPTEPLLARWTVEASAGDCNDYAVTKRHRLLAAGWPASRLRLAVAVTQEGVGHLVLIARAADGDFVLDNMTDEVKRWADGPYQWVSMQSGENPRFWVAIGERGRAARRRLEMRAAANDS